MNRTAAILILGAVALATVLGATELQTGARTPRVAFAAFTPPPGGTYFALDCDLASPGIQDSCTLPAGTTQHDVGIVFGNVDIADADIGAYVFTVRGDNGYVFEPAFSAGSNLDRNPDFHESDVGSWFCLPIRDSDPSASGTNSSLSCWSSSGNGPTTATGSEQLLAVLHLNVHGGGSGTLALEQVSLGSNIGFELGSCEPVSVVAALCSGATILVLGASATSTLTPTATGTSTPTLTPFPGAPTPTATAVPAPTITVPGDGAFLALDCDVSALGIQYGCSLPPGTSQFDLAVVAGNIESPGDAISGFNFDIVGDNQPVFTPAEGLDADLSANPDFSEESVVFDNTWACTPPTPRSDQDPNPLSSTSFLSCYVFGGGTPFVRGSIKVLAHLHVTVQGGGTGTFNLANASVSDIVGFEIMSCNPLNVTEGVCFGATVVSIPCTDADCDGVSDPMDNCPSIANANQGNADRNIIVLHPGRVFDDTTRPHSDVDGDACDSDDDNDGIPESDELTGVACGGVVTNPWNADTDGDRALDGPECALGTSPNNSASTPNQSQCGPSVDGDGDAIPAFRESCYYNTSDSTINSDGDNCSDRREVMSVNADFIVNAIDLSQVAQAFGPYPLGAPAYKYDFDVTKDGNINAIDLSQIAQAFGACP